MRHLACVRLLLQYEFKLPEINYDIQSLDEMIWGSVQA